MKTTATKERPILFSGPMVKAILDGRKTQTRRVVKNPHGYIGYQGAGGRDSPDWNDPTNWGFEDEHGEWYLLKAEKGDHQIPCPYGQPGDRLWVRESLRQRSSRQFSNSPNAADTEWVYAADDAPIAPNYLEMTGWDLHRSKPSIHMPRWASRITLEITDVRVERLNEISEEDAIAEGVQCDGVPASLTNRGAFAKLWESINGESSWAANPWVWAITFKRV